MSDDNEQFSRDTFDKAVAWVKETARLEACMVCGNNELTIPPHLVTQVRLTPAGQVQLGGASYPSVMLICRRCGYTHLFNAVVMGVVRGDEDGPR